MSTIPLRIILGSLIWIGITGLQIILLAIAHFFERTSQQQTWYQLYLIPILFTIVGAARYLGRIFTHDAQPDFAGDPISDILFLFSGLLLIGLGNLLYERMMGERGHDRY
ncbi:MAG: hypothetical protein JXR84_23995 [Anaerolineae bacterium]|nr:hypothetical protein [Anaerolineae bacterium]